MRRKNDLKRIRHYTLSQTQRNGSTLGHTSLKKWGKKTDGGGGSGRTRTKTEVWCRGTLHALWDVVGYGGVVEVEVEG